jgi:hypothetical protein
MAPSIGPFIDLKNENLARSGGEGGYTKTLTNRKQTLFLPNIPSRSVTGDAGLTKMLCVGPALARAGTHRRALPPKCTAHAHGGQHHDDADLKGTVRQIGSMSYTLAR